MYLRGAKSSFHLKVLHALSCNAIILTVITPYRVDSCREWFPSSIFVSLIISRVIMLIIPNSRGPYSLLIGAAKISRTSGASDSVYSYRRLPRRLSAIKITINSKYSKYKYRYRYRYRYKCGKHLAQCLMKIGCDYRIGEESYVCYTLIEKT